MAFQVNFCDFCRIWEVFTAVAGCFQRSLSQGDFRAFQNVLKDFSRSKGFSKGYGRSFRRFQEPFKDVLGMSRQGITVFKCVSLLFIRF